jgi:hypothetical protein
LGRDPIIFKSATSKAQIWGKAGKRPNNPSPIFENKYGSKRKNSDVIKIDPRKSVKTGQESSDDLLFGIQSMHSNQSTMWERILRFKYNDYSLKEERSAILKELVQQFLSNLSKDVASFEKDPLSTQGCVHVTG